MFNKKKMAIILLMIFISANSFAQQKNINQLWQFHSINNVGLLEAEAGSAFQVQTINGVQYKSWFVGAGAGLDYYRYRTIPLFIDVRKEFGKSINKFFVYTDGGINFYWKRDKDVKQFQIDDKFKNGFYGEAGAGYKFKLSQKLSLLISGAYSYKKITEEGTYYYFGPISISPYLQYQSNPLEKINYNLNRLVFKAGIEF